MFSSVNISQDSSDWWRRLGVLHQPRDWLWRSSQKCSVCRCYEPYSHTETHQ